MLRSSYAQVTPLGNIKTMAAPKKNTEQLSLRVDREVIAKCEKYSKDCELGNKNQFAVSMLLGAMEWIEDPNPLADLPLETRKLKRKLHGHTTERLGPITREEPPPAGSTVTDGMLRVLEQALSAKDDLISMQRAEIERLRAALARNENPSA
jgi:hypothetical protein